MTREYSLRQQGFEDLELERLALLAGRHDPFTERQLDEIGVMTGWRCLDVGAGSGTVTRMLAERTGAGGSVLAIDLDTRLLQGLSSDTVEVREHDLLGDRLQDAGFDLAHARCLLMHLPSRVQALARMRDAVKPGGLVAVLDKDFTVLDVSRPTPAWKRAFSAFCDAAVAAGWDPAYGSRLRSDLEAIELTDIRSEYVLERGPGGSPEAELFALTLERLRDGMRALAADDRDIDAAQGLLRSPEIDVTYPSTWLAIGRRPHT